MRGLARARLVTYEGVMASLPGPDTPYEFSDGGLVSRLTGQRLHVLKAGDDVFCINYEDQEITEELEGRFETFRFGSGLARKTGQWLRFNWPLSSLVRAHYGRWRRLTFFLLDAVPALLEHRWPERVSNVRLFGGWFNGEWNESGWFRANRLTPQTLLCGSKSACLFPLAATAPLWRYELGKAGRLQAAIKVQAHEPFAMLPLADATVPIADQLANVPRCLSSNGDCLFFSRVISFQGPDYRPGICHGFVTDGFIFELMDYHSVPIAAPIRRQAERRFDEALEWETDGLSPRARLHPPYCERLLFAGVDAHTAMQAALDRSRLTMVDPEHGQEALFFPRWNHQSRAPYRAGFAGIEGG